MHNVSSEGTASLFFFLIPLLDEGGWLAACSSRFMRGEYVIKKYRGSWSVTPCIW